MPGVSVIVPVYNVEKYLADCVNSIVGQTFGDWELILVDDGSTDRSGAIADDLAASDSRITAIHTANAGPGAARNTGVAHSVAPFITFVDSDDYLSPDALALLLSAADATGAEVVSTPLRRTRRPIFGRRNSAPEVVDPEQFVVDMLYQHTLSGSSNGKLFARRLLEAEKYKEGILYEDLELMPRLCLQANKIAVVDRNIYFYRERPGSIISSWNEHRLDVLDVTDSIAAAMANKSPRLQAAAADRRFSAHYNMFILARRHGETAAAHRCWQAIRAGRRRALADPQVRLKNKLGALLSLLGRPLLLKLV